MPKLEIKKKSLRLVNVLCYPVDVKKTQFDLNTEIEKMQTYIKTKGMQQLGPLIQYMNTHVNQDGNIDVDMVFMLQCNNIINKVEKSYSMESMIRVENCMYVHYIGPQDKIKFAYDKINLEAFESDVKLVGESYTIFLDNNEEEENLVTDIFMTMMK